MDRSDVIYLIDYRYKSDSIGQRIPCEVKRELFCNIQSIGMSEFFEAGKIGLTPELKATILSFEYQGEEVAEYRGRKYTIYRTYQGRNDAMELYLSRKEGIANGKACSDS